MQNPHKYCMLLIEKLNVKIEQNNTKRKYLVFGEGNVWGSS